MRLIVTRLTPAFSASCACERPAAPLILLTFWAGPSPERFFLMGRKVSLLTPAAQPGRTNKGSALTQEVHYGACVTNSNDILARQLRAAREERNWTQAELAARARVGEATVKRIERGLGARRGTVEALAKALGVRPSELSEPREPPEELLELIDQWVAGEKMRPRLEPPVTPEEVEWLRGLAPEIWSELPFTETTLEALVRAHRSRRSARKI